MRCPLPDDGRFKGKVALVTGGGSGIGEACCLRLAAEAAVVVVADVQLSAAERVAQTIRDRGGVAEPVWVDVRDPRSVDAMVDFTTRELGDWT